MSLQQFVNAVAMMAAMADFRRAAFFAMLLAPAVAAAADPRWIRMSSPDFEILSTAPESETRGVLEHFERIADFFEQGQFFLPGGVQPASAGPVHIIVFGSLREFEPYRPNETASAFYRQTEAGDTIVLGGVGQGAYPTAVHEYTHWIVQRSGMRLPPWLNEGLAELYSTIKPVGGQAIVGSPIPGRVRALATGRWTPLAVILEADQNSPYYNEKSHAGSFYNEAWALTHMFAMTPSYGPRFASLLRAIQTGTPWREALETTYGKPLEAIEKDLGEYIRTGVFKTAVVEIKVRNPASRVSGRAPAEIASTFPSAFDVKLALLAISNRPGNEAGMQREFEALAAQEPLRAEPQIALAYLAWRARNQEAAAKYFARAIELGSRDLDVLWNYGRLAAGSDPSAAARALSLLLIQRPDRSDARLLLAELQLHAGQPRNALETLASVRSIGDDDAPRLNRLQAFAGAGLDRRDEARSAARRWMDTAHDLSDRANAQRFLEYLDRSDRIASGDAASVMAELWAAAPGPDFSSVAIPDPPLPSVAGQLVALECEGERSRLVVEAEGVRYFTFEDGERVMAYGPGARAAHIELPCGKVRPVAVRVQYEPERAPGDALPNAPIPLARAIYLAALPEPLESESAGVPAAPARPVIGGAFIDMDCRKQPPKLVLRTASARAVLLLDDVRKLEIGGLPMGSEIACGPQKGAPVWIEYEPPSARQTGVTGLVRVLHFDPMPGSAR